ncbi:galactose mutarotase [Candidatus Roizmanbacteria bacterium]|nr:MAG: galactose mutarotase [Candidatus Roizmanbacteria bacterium]
MDDFHVVTYKNSKLQLAPKYGCNPNILILNGQKVLDGNETEELLKEDYICKGDFLAPFPNRVCDGIYTFEGETYQLYPNETARGHALHGFLMKKACELVSQDERAESTVAVFRTTFIKGEFQGYPFDLEMTLTFTLKETALDIEITAKNTGTTNAPYGIGWHPYLTAGKKIDDCKLRIPAKKIMEVRTDKELIPTGKLLENEFGPELKTIGATQLDTCFTDLVDHTVKFENIELWMEESMQYFQSYTPEERLSIAVEPMSCAPDAFNNGLGLITLEPGKSISHQFGIRLV